MSEIFLQKFYDNVKDPSWPQLIETYSDFVKLPDSIKNECYQQHGLESTLNQIEDSDYWLASHRSRVVVYRHHSLVFIPVPKCGFIYYHDLFTRMGWEQITLDKVNFDQHIVFTAIMNPTDRYLKGLTEWFWKRIRFDNFDNLEQQELFFNIASDILITDIHTMPYTVEYQGIINKIHWIPSDNLSDNEVKQSMMHLFKKHNYNIQLPLDEPRLHQSNPKKLKLYQALKNVHIRKKQKTFELLYVFLAEDLKFYRQLVNKFDPTWSDNI